MVKSIIYQLLPRLWGRGRFSSIDDASLKYIKSLGADAVWFTGVVRHATTLPPEPSNPAIVKGDAGSPYAISDYFDVNPYMADVPSSRMDEFRALLDRAHSNSLKVIIDFVPNHVARDYRAPGSLGEGDDKSLHWSPDNDFFYYPGEELVLPLGNGSYREFPARASGNCFSSRPSVNDWWETVKINYCDFHTGTWDRMMEIIRFWAGMGIDGFRCDMAELVPLEFWRWMIPKAKKEFPGLRFIAEVYEAEKYASFSDAGFDLLYDKSLMYDTLRSVIERKCPAREITRAWQRQGLPPERLLNFLENHDEQRIASDFFAGRAESAFAALAVSALFNTSSFMLYFGQEAGEKGMGNEPFSGRNGRTSIFDSGAPESLLSLQAFAKGDSDALDTDQKRILGRYRELLALSKQAVFSKGLTYDLCWCQGEGFNPDSDFAFLRGLGSDRRLVICNFSAHGRDISVRIPEEAWAYLGISKKEAVHTAPVPSNDFVTTKLK